MRRICLGKRGRVKGWRGQMARAGRDKGGKSQV